MDELKIVSVRLVEEQPWKSRSQLNSPEKVAEFLSEELSCYDRELFCCLNMSTKSQVINMSIMSIGTLNAALVHPREVFKSAILSNANSVILAHNHPSWDCTPSEEDRNITRRLEKSGRLLGIEILDHIITGEPGVYYSFREKGILPVRNIDIHMAADKVVRSR